MTKAKKQTEEELTKAIWARVGSNDNYYGASAEQMLMQVNQVKDYLESFSHTDFPAPTTEHLNAMFMLVHSICTVMDFRKGGVNYGDYFAPDDPRAGVEL
tara:strand:+ start:1154 stop:1453 length:300 start_codon:yes stop_codon:yes gene_type:complete